MRKRHDIPKKNNETEAKKIKAAVKDARNGTVNAGDESKTNGQTVGRKPGEPSRNKAFMLPLDMIDNIESIASEKFGGNSSALARDLFKNYFLSLNK